MTAFLASLSRLFSSSIGRKWIVALTGVALILFLLGHMSGNLVIFLGPEAFNSYAHFLHTMAHGAGLWIARIGLLVVFTLHVAFTILLARENRAARPERYRMERSVRSKTSTRLMIVSGLTILAFLIYHLLHFTVRVPNNYETYQTTLHGDPTHDAYSMVIAGFRWLPAVIFYLIGMSLLCSHLHHGVSSVFQTLGLRTRQNRAAVEAFGKALSLLIFVGFISVPLAVQLRLVNFHPVQADAAHAEAVPTSPQPH